MIFGKYASITILCDKDNQYQIAKRMVLRMKYPYKACKIEKKLTLRSNYIGSSYIMSFSQFFIDYLNYYSKVNKKK